MYIADVRLKGSHPLRASLGPEYALAIIWAEGALTKAGPEHREDIERFLEAARGHHNFNWRSPAGPSHCYTKYRTRLGVASSKVDS